MHPVFRAFFGLLAAGFLFGLYLQLGRSEPIMGIAIYAIAAGLCGLAAMNNPAPATFNTVTIIAALFWAGYLGNQVYGNGHVHQVQHHRMTGNLMNDTEEGRDMAGLLAIAAALGLLVGAQGYTRYRPARHSDRRRQNFR